jgi:hypothetical protein
VTVNTILQNNVKKTKLKKKRKKMKTPRSRWSLAVTQYHLASCEADQEMWQKTVHAVILCTVASLEK